jgi:hypothetical protein
MVCKITFDILLFNSFTFDSTDFTGYRESYFASYSLFLTYLVSRVRVVMTRRHAIIGSQPLFNKRTRHQKQKWVSEVLTHYEQWKPDFSSELPAVRMLVGARACLLVCMCKMCVSWFCVCCTAPKNGTPKKIKIKPTEFFQQFFFKEKWEFFR